VKDLIVMNYMDLKNLEIYNISMAMGEQIWTLVGQWKYFEKDTIGKQLVRSADSVAANISEGFGRYHFNDSRHFYYFARGSLYETKTWIEKAKNRNLINPEDHNALVTATNRLAVKLNNFIKTTGSKFPPGQ
jgi:four helix bundle protein